MDSLSPPSLKLAYESEDGSIPHPPSSFTRRIASRLSPLSRVGPDFCLLPSQRRWR